VTNDFCFHIRQSRALQRNSPVQTESANPPAANPPRLRLHRLSLRLWVPAPPLRLLWSSLGTALGQRHFAFEKLELSWKRSSDAESARRLRPHTVRSLDKAPAQVLGLFFTPCCNSFLLPLPVYALQNERSLTNRVLNQAAN